MRGMCRRRRSAVSKSQLSKLVKRRRRAVRCSAKVMAARSAASWRVRAPPTTTPESHISREGMKPFTKPPKMTTSKVRPKRSSGGADGDGRSGRAGASSARLSALSCRGRPCHRAFFACFAVARRGEGRAACGVCGCRRALCRRVWCDVGFGLVLLALLPEQSLGCAVGGEQALGEGAGCGKPGQGIGIQGREGFREVEALGLRDAPQLGDGGAAVEG